MFTTVAMAVAITVVLFAALTEPAPSSRSTPGPSCRAPSAPPAWGTPVAGGKFVMIEQADNDVVSSTAGEPASQTWLLVAAASNSTFILYVMDASEFSGLGWTSNASGQPSQSTHLGPAEDYLWSSGSVTSTSQDVLIGFGTWYVVVYDPGSDQISVGASVGGCSIS